MQFRSKPPVILVFGISGCAQEVFLKTLRDREQQRFSLQITPKKWRNPLQASQLRIELERKINKAQRKIESRPGTYLVGLHATHLAEAFIFSSIPIEAIRALHPAFCITIFDDLYAIQARLRNSGYPYSYRDLILWLRAELMMADLIADEVVNNKAARTKNFTLAVKHPKSTAVRLVENSDMPKVYAAYSITGVLRERDLIIKKRLFAENIKYRRNLHTLGAIVFDPGTLDDRIVVNKVLSHKRPRTGYITITSSERWPYKIGDRSDAPMVGDPANAFPIRIPHVEAFVLNTTPQTPHRPYSDIDALITQVDLRYVSQADVVTVWRPFCRGTHSVGCFREVQTAIALDRKVLAYCPREDLDMLGAESRPLHDMWPREVPLIEQETEFWSSVKAALSTA